MRGKIPQVEVNFGPPRVKLRPWADWRFESVVPQGFPVLCLRKCEAAFAFRSRSRLRRSLAAQAGQYFTALEREKIGAPQIQQRLTGRAAMISPCSSWSAGRTAARKYLQIKVLEIICGQGQGSPSSNRRQSPPSQLAHRRRMSFLARRNWLSSIRGRLVNSNLDAGFVIQNGVKILIKRQRFEQFLDKLSSI